MTLSLTTAFDQGLTKMFVFLKKCMLFLLPIASIQETDWFKKKKFWTHLQVQDKS